MVEGRCGGTELHTRSDSAATEDSMKTQASDLASASRFLHCFGNLSLPRVLGGSSEVMCLY